MPPTRSSTRASSASSTTTFPRMASHFWFWSSSTACRATGSLRLARATCRSMPRARSACKCSTSLKPHTRRASFIATSSRPTCLSCTTAASRCSTSALRACANRWAAPRRRPPGRFSSGRQPSWPPNRYSAGPAMSMPGRTSGPSVHLFSCWRAERPSTRGRDRRCSSTC